MELFRQLIQGQTDKRQGYVKQKCIYVKIEMLPMNVAMLGWTEL